MGNRTHPDLDLIALGIQQPWAELILRGLKTIEVRSQATRVRGPIYLYTSQKASTLPAARDAAQRYQIDIDSLPKGQLVGTVEIVESRACTAGDATAACLPADILQGQQGWMLQHPERLPQPLQVRFLPYGVWFYPFRRKTDSTQNGNAASKRKSAR